MLHCNYWYIVYLQIVSVPVSLLYSVENNTYHCYLNYLFVVCVTRNESNLILSILSYLTHEELEPSCKDDSHTQVGNADLKGKTHPLWKQKQSLIAADTPWYQVITHITNREEIPEAITWANVHQLSSKESLGNILQKADDITNRYLDISTYIEQGYIQKTNISLIMIYLCFIYIVYHRVSLLTVIITQAP